MSNLDVVLASFWQLARHWQHGEAAKLKLSCEAGSLKIQLNAMINTENPSQLVKFDHCDFVNVESSVRNHMSKTHKPFHCEYCNF